MCIRDRGRAGIINTKKMKKKVSELIQKYGFGIRPDAIVETLTIAQRQTIEILKALSEDSKLIIMDEPTASLSTKESDALFQTVSYTHLKGAEYRRKDRAVIYFRLADGKISGYRSDGGNGAERSDLRRERRTR